MKTEVVIEGSEANNKTAAASEDVDRWQPGVCNACLNIKS